MDVSWPDRTSADSSTLLVELGFTVNARFVARLDTFLSEDVRMQGPQADPKYVRWAEWGLCHSTLVTDSLDMMGGFEGYGARGLHVVLREQILHFNKYDSARDIYRTPQAHTLRTTTQEKTLVSKARYRVARAKMGMTKKRIVKTNMLYRKVDVPDMPVPKAETTRLALIEDTNGPKVSLLYCLYYMCGDLLLTRLDRFVLKLVEFMYKKNKDSEEDNLVALRYHAF